MHQKPPPFLYIFLLTQIYSYGDTNKVGIVYKKKKKNLNFFSFALFFLLFPSLSPTQLFPSLSFFSRRALPPRN